MVMKGGNSNNPLMYDLSFMYSKECDLDCWFCMYSSGPEVKDRLDLELLAGWLKTVDFSKVASFGIYGGEPGANLDGFGRVLRMLPEGKPKWVITNGTWSCSADRLDEFLNFAARFRLHIVVSGTPYHRNFQNRPVLEELARRSPEAITLKPLEENFIPMGRMATLPVTCTAKCSWWTKALRIAVQPDGTVIYQNCDGRYPTVGSIREPFSLLDGSIQWLRKNGFAAVCEYYRKGPRSCASPESVSPLNILNDSSRVYPSS